MEGSLTNTEKVGGQRHAEKSYGEECSNFNRECSMFKKSTCVLINKGPKVKERTQHRISRKRDRKGERKKSHVIIYKKAGVGRDTENVWALLLRKRESSKQRKGKKQVDYV